MLRRKTAHFRETADQKNTHRSLYLVDPDGTLFRMSRLADASVPSLSVSVCVTSMTSMIGVSECPRRSRPARSRSAASFRHWRGDLFFRLQFDSSDRQITQHFLISGFPVPGEGVKLRKLKTTPYTVAKPTCIECQVGRLRQSRPAASEPWRLSK
jgi:hypothetical protein